MKKLGWRATSSLTRLKMLQFTKSTQWKTSMIKVYTQKSSPWISTRAIARINRKNKKIPRLISKYHNFSTLKLSPKTILKSGPLFFSILDNCMRKNRKKIFSKTKHHWDKFRKMTLPLSSNFPTLMLGLRLALMARLSSVRHRPGPGNSPLKISSKLSLICLNA